MSIHINDIVGSNATKTPYEIIHRVKPDYSVIHPFGCHAFAHIPKASRPEDSTGLVPWPVKEEIRRNALGPSASQGFRS